MTTEFKLRQTFSNGFNQYCYGPKILKIDKDFKYIIYYDNVKIPLTFISKLAPPSHSFTASTQIIQLVNRYKIKWMATFIVKTN